MFKKTLVTILVLSTLIVLNFSSLSPKQLYHSAIRKYVGSRVVILTEGKGGGSGFHATGASGTTYIVTNTHVCNIVDESGIITVIDFTGTKHKRKVLKRHKNHDLCLVEGLPGFSGLSVSNSSFLGQIVNLVGHPALRPLSISEGEVVGTKRIALIIGKDIPDHMCFGDQIDLTKSKDLGALIFALLNGTTTICVGRALRSTMFHGITYGGNSGSPVVNSWGTVVGVLFASGGHLTDAYLVPGDILEKFLKEN